MITDMSTEAQTQAIPRVPVAVACVTGARAPAPGGDAKVAAAEPATEAAAPPPMPEPDVDVADFGPSTEIACEVSVEDIYEAGLASLEALHERWSAAMAEVCQAPASGELAEAAA